MKNNFAQLAQQHYAAYNVEQRGPGRRATREREEHVENVALTQSKFPTTIDIKFDIKNQHFIKLWQRNYYDHIIRNEKSGNQIRQYILDNPVNWENDTFYLKI